MGACGVLGKGGRVGEGPVLVVRGMSESLREVDQHTA